MIRAALVGLGLLVALPARATSPVGQVTVDCERVEGWAQDPDNPAQTIAVHLYFDGPAGDPAATGIPLTANLPLAAGCAGDQCAHGFRSGLPLSRLDGQPHPVHAYGIDLEGIDPNPELTMSPGVYTCPPLPIVMGEKRHIAGPAILDQWKFSTYFDLMKVADLDLASVPKGATLELPPQLAVAEGTTEPLWLLDQGFKRVVPPELIGAWRFDPATAVVMAGAELMAVPEGTPLTGRPILAQGSGPEVYLLDVHQCGVDDPNPVCAPPEEPTTGGGESGDLESTGESGDSSSGGTTNENVSSSSSGGTGNDMTGAMNDTSATGEAEPGEQGAEGGCGCRGGAGGWLGLVALLAGRRRRVPRSLRA